MPAATVGTFFLSDVYYPLEQQYNMAGNDKAVQKADKKISRLWYQLISMLRKLANNGNVDSMYELAQLYDGGRPSMADPQMAHYWYIQAARKGHKFAGQ